MSERIEWLLANTRKQLADAARETGIDKGYLSRLRHGKKTNISRDKASLLAAFYGVDVDWLLEGIGQPALPNTVAPSRVQEVPDSAAIAAQNMTTEELVRGIEKHTALLNDRDLQFLRSANSKIIETFARELSGRSDQPGQTKRTNYS